MIFIGGPWHGRDEQLPEGERHWRVKTSDEDCIYLRQTIAAPGIGYRDVMVHPVYQGTPLFALEVIKNVLLEQWLRDA